MNPTTALQRLEEEEFQSSKLKEPNNTARNLDLLTGLCSYCGSKGVVVHYRKNILGQAREFCEPCIESLETENKDLLK